MKKILTTLILVATCVLTAQDKNNKIVISTWDGMMISGYVDQGAFVNFGGPSIKYISKPMAIGFGVLPSMRIKQDMSGTPTRNNWVMPALGYGITFSYKHVALQLPFYYNAKTATTNGQWNPGLGIGYKF